jgi:hypothetical protein
MSTPTLHLFPGETEAAAIRRRVKMHEFLMTGGTQLGVVDGKMTYSDPIDAATTPVCPWHDEDCIAWAEIQAGRTTPYTDGPTLAELRDLTNEDYTEGRAKLSIEVGRNEPTSVATGSFPTKPGVYAAAGPKTGGNPWDKGGPSSYTPGSNVGTGGGWARKNRIEDARDTVEREFSGLMPEGDVIEIDGDEDDE